MPTAGEEEQDSVSVGPGAEVEGNLLAVDNGVAGTHAQHHGLRRKNFKQWHTQFITDKKFADF